MASLASEFQLIIGNIEFAISRPHAFGLVIDRPIGSLPDDCPDDYLHEVFLAPAHRDSFFKLIEMERLVVCKNVRTNAASYQKVRGKSSVAKLSQAEYYHHDGCSSPIKPKVVEIRFPHQDVSRNIATAITPFPEVMRAMLMALPESFLKYEEMESFLDAFSGPSSAYPPAETWDQIQGKVTRMVRKELDAEACRSYFRSVDQSANAYVLPWEMGESRLMLNAHDDLTHTMQHRRSYQKPREEIEQNGSLVKRWTAEEA